MSDDAIKVWPPRHMREATPPAGVHPPSPPTTPPTPIWFEDKEVRVAVSNAMVKLERWRRLRYGRTLREVPLSNFSRGLVEELKAVFSEDNEGKSIPSMLTDEELAFGLQAAVLLVIMPLLNGDEQAALVRGVAKRRVVSK